MTSTVGPWEQVKNLISSTSNTCKLPCLLWREGRGGRGELLLAASQGFLQGRGIYLFPKQSSPVAAAGNCSPLSCNKAIPPRQRTGSVVSLKPDARRIIFAGLVTGRNLKLACSLALPLSGLSDKYHSISAKSRCFHKAVCHFGNLITNVSQAMIKSE